MRGDVLGNARHERGDGVVVVVFHPVPPSDLDAIARGETVAVVVLCVVQSAAVAVAP